VSLTLTEVKSRFKIRSGEIEIEYEGPLKEVNERYESALKWLTSQPRKESRKRGKKEKKKEEEEEKKDKRGGPRKPIYTPKIGELVEEGFFAKRKSLDDVIEGLIPKNVPTRGSRARRGILTNLRRRIARRDAKLKGAKEEDIWYFWVD